MPPGTSEGVEGLEVVQVDELVSDAGVLDEVEFVDFPCPNFGVEI